jgi:type IV pilus assembly protein PilA
MDMLKAKKEELQDRGYKGFTLMEMLIVVAIIAVLIAIAIPIFTSQLERARDSTSVANIRSAYAEAQATALVGKSTTDDNIDSSSTYTVKTSSGTIIVKNVRIESQAADNWNNYGDEIGFINDKVTAAVVQGLDDGKPGVRSVTFTYEAGKLTGITLSPAPAE